MRLIFFGTPLFAVPTLENLLKANHELLAVVTQPDRASGRALKVRQGPVKQFAEKNKLDILQPERIDTSGFQEELRNLKPDLFVVVSYGEILPVSLLNIPRFYCLGVHASLLPKYRGASPIPSTLLNREEETGVTLMRMTQRTDAGDILLQRKIPIQLEDDAVNLSEKLSIIGGELIIEALQLVESGKTVFQPQDDAKATYAKKLKKEDGKIDWSRSAEEIQAMVRALVPWPSAYTFYHQKRLQIWKASIRQKAAYGRYGQILTINDSEGIAVSTGMGVLLLHEVGLENRRRMSALEFVRGYRMRPGDVLG